MEGFDLVVIGSGPAGYVPAVRAAQLGMRTAVVEERETGGTCLNRGCIPTKALVASAELVHAARGARRLGLSGSLEPDWPAVSKRRDMVVSRLRKGVEARLSTLGIEMVRGRGTLLGPGAVSVAGRELRSRFVLLSPGSMPLIPRALSVEGALTSDGFLTMERLPGSMTIVGGGVIGCEFASVMSAFGVSVTVLEMLGDILPGVDSDMRTIVRNSMSRMGVAFRTGIAAAGASVAPGEAEVTLADGSTVVSDTLVVAAGRVPATSGMGLAEAGVGLRGAAIVVDESMMTTLPGVYAAGDATGAWQLAHAGSAQALCAVASMAGLERPAPHPDRMPSCIFTIPEIAVAGPGEDELRRRGVDIEVTRSRYAANGRAVGLGESEGLLKLVSSAADGRLLGVQIAGRDASSLIGEAVVALEAGLKASRLGEIIHPHPTLGELFMEAGEDSGPGSIHG